MMQIWKHGPYTVSLLAEESSQDIVYAVMDGEDAEAVWRLLKAPRPALAAISGVDWNRELSPWPAPRAFRGGEDFGGGGAAFLDALTGQIIPGMETHFGLMPARRTIAGYSLAGLFALWSVFETDLFDQALSVSGSLWFDGFSEFMDSHTQHHGVKFVYLSVGDREKNARSPRMAAVEDCTRQAAELLRRRGISTAFELNRGGHFDDVPGRIARAIHAGTAYAEQASARTV